MVTKWNGFVKKHSRTHLRYYLRILVDRLKETTKSLFATFGEPGTYRAQVSCMTLCANLFAMKFLLMQFCLSLRHVPTLGPETILSSLLSNFLNLRPFLAARRHVSQSETHKKLQRCVILIFKLLQQKERKKDREIAAAGFVQLRYLFFLYKFLSECDLYPLVCQKYLNFTRFRKALYHDPLLHSRDRNIFTISRRTRFLPAE